MTVEVLPLAPPPTGWTVEDLDSIPENGLRYELVDGVPHVMASPKMKHQWALKSLNAALDAVAPPHVIVMPGIGVELAPDQCPVPDLVVLRGYDGEASRVPADLVLMAVEIVSPSSRTDDRFRKPAQYAQAGIPVYLRVELDPPYVVAYAIGPDGLYVETGRAVPGQQLVVNEPFPFALDPATLLR